MPRDVLTVPEFVNCLLTALAEDEEFGDVNAVCDLLPADLRAATAKAVGELTRRAACHRFVYVGPGPSPEKRRRMVARLYELAPRMAEYLAEQQPPP